MQLINLHTHHTGREDSLSIRNVFAQDLTSDPPNCLFSAGLHPWHIDQVNPERCFQNLERNCLSENMLAIGECGIDRSIKTDFVLQTDIFKIQVKLAEKYHKPLIIHCVRAYSDLVHLKKISKFSVPWIIHGFNGNQDVMKSLIKFGFHLSIGKPLLDNPAKRNLIREIPTDRLFLETDDRDTDIASAYIKTAQLLGISEESLAELIEQNFQKLFGDVKLVAKD